MHSSWRGPLANSTVWSRDWRLHMLSGPLQCPAGSVQHDYCELKIWPMFKEQLQVTGPYDAGPVAPDGAIVTEHGCCSTGDDALGAGAVILIVGVGAGLIAIGRRRKKPCCR